MKRELALFRRTKSPKNHATSIPLTYHCMDITTGTFTVTHIFNHTTGSWDVIGRKSWNK